MFALLRDNPSFRRLFLAHATSRSGDAFNTVALIVLVFQLTGSGFGVAATVVFEVLPILLLGPIAGLVADRYPRRRVMIVADLARAALVSLLVLTHSWVGVVFVVAFGLSVGSILFNPAASSLIPDFIDKDQIVRANTALWTVAVVAQIVLAPLAGALIAWAGVGPAFALNAASDVGSAMFLTRLDAGRSPATIIVRGWAGVRARHRRGTCQQPVAPPRCRADPRFAISWCDERPPGAACIRAPQRGAFRFRRTHCIDRIRCGGRAAITGPLHQARAQGVVVRAVRAARRRGSHARHGVLTGSRWWCLCVVWSRHFHGVLWNGARLVSLGLGGWLAETVSIQAVYAVGGLVLLAAAAIGLTTKLPPAVP